MNIDHKSSVPKIKFEYAEVLDMLCMDEHPDLINQKNIDALILALPNWNAMWDKCGHPILKHITAMLDLGFHDQELIVNFTLRPDIYATSHPLIVNAHPFLRNPPTFQENTIFINFIVHELLHRYLDQNFSGLFKFDSPKSSKLMKTHESEDIFVKAHLHLFALQKEAYLELGLADSWKKIESWISTVPGDSYQRAYEIVTLDHSESYIKELTDAAHNLISDHPLIKKEKNTSLNGPLT